MNVNNPTKAQQRACIIKSMERLEKVYPNLCKAAKKRADNTLINLKAQFDKLNEVVE